VNWTENGNVVSNSMKYTFTVTGERTLTANFKVKTYNIILIADPPEGGTVLGAGEYEHGWWLTVEAIPDDPCYEFDSWTEDGVVVHLDEVYSFMVMGPRVLTAHFVKKEYKVTLSENPGGSGTVIGGDVYTCGDVVKITAKPEICHKFVNWTENGIEITTEKDYVFTILENRSFVANFILIDYDVIVQADPEGGGEVTGGGSYACKSEATVTTTPNPCYTFIEWTYNGVWVSNSPIYSFTVTEPCTLIAHYEKRNFEIKVEANPPIGGSVDGGGIFPCDTFIYVTATPAKGWQFFNWTENGIPISPSNPTCLVHVTGDRTLIANFIRKDYNIILFAEPSIGGTTAINGVQSTGGVFAYEEEISVEAIPNECWNFAYWTEYGVQGTVSTDNPYPFTVTGSRILTAHFEQKNYDIVLLQNPQGGTTTINDEPTSGGSYPCGDTITVNVIPDDGWDFDRWTEGNGDFITNDAELSFEVTKNRTLIANFVMSEYEITVSAEPPTGGTASGDGSGIHYGEWWQVLAKETTPHYHFVEWREDDQPVYGDLIYDFEVKRSRHLVAHFELDTYEIILLADPGPGGTADTSGFYPYGKEIKVLATPNPGYDFVEWSENGTPFHFSEDYPFTVTGPRTLTAHFTRQSYEIVVQADPDNGGDVSGDGIYLYEDPATVTAEAISPYVFTHWTDKDGNIFTQNPYTFEVYRSDTLTAHFAFEKYEIVVEANPQNGGIVTGGGSYSYGDEATVEAEANAGWQFINWTEDDNPVWNTPTYSFTVERARTLTANFERKNYEIVLLTDPTSGGTADTSGFYLYDEEITVIATANPTYEFINWTEEGNPEPVSYTPEYTFVVKESRTLTAHFAFESYEIIVLANPSEGGIVTGGGNYTYNDEATVSATPNEGWEFVNWTDETDVPVCLTENYPFTVTGARTLTAHFTRQSYEIVVQANPENGGEVEGGGIYIYEATATVKATANPHYDFVNWTDEDGKEVSTDLFHSFTVTENRTLTANFTFETYDIVLLADPPNGGEVSGGGNFAYGTPITVFAIADSLYHFVNWTDEDDKEVSTDADYPFTVTGPRTLTAHFEKIRYQVIAIVDDEYYGYTTGSDIYDAYTTATVEAWSSDCYRFKNWTIDDQIVSTSNPYEFTVTGNVTLVAHFFTLDFDTYCPTLWNNTFMLDLKKLEEDGYDVIGCKWYKNDAEQKYTRTIDEFSYSAGPKATDLLEPAPTYYSFRLITRNRGELCSTLKFINNNIAFPTPENKMWAHPNPVLSGVPFTVEGVAKNDQVRVYNQYGICISNAIATGETITLTLNVQAGVYVVRANEKQVKVVIVR
jgi:hypothetical protein